MKKFNFSWKITLFCTVLMAGMFRMSYWQWERYLDKEIYVQELDARLAMDIVPLTTLLPLTEPASLLHRRISVSGTWDFKHEMIKRNRKHDEDGPGVHVITPFHLNNNQGTILVNRGYIPLSVKAKKERKAFQENAPQEFIGLIKLTEVPRWALSPKDPPAGGDNIWRDAWLRVDIQEIEKQLPYELLPIQIEMISSQTEKSLHESLVINSKSREEIFYLTDTGTKVSSGRLDPSKTYPLPAFSTVVPSATHLLYVFEWIFMALMTAAIGLVLQFRRQQLM